MQCVEQYLEDNCCNVSLLDADSIHFKMWDQISIVIKNSLCSFILVDQCKNGSIILKLLSTDM